MAGCTRSGSEPPSSLPPGWRVAHPAASAPARLIIDGREIDATYADWSAVSGEPPLPITSVLSPTWLDVVRHSDGSRLSIAFSDGPHPSAVSVVGYQAVNSDGTPIGAGVRDSGVLPAAGVAESTDGISFDWTDRPDYLAIQFRWLVPGGQRAPGQLDRSSVTAAYLIHLVDPPNAS